MSPEQTMRRIDALLSHVWMVRTFLKHSPEVEDDEELAEVHRTLYDYMLAVGGPWKEQNSAEYLKAARKKLSKLQRTVEHFTAIQPEVSSHTNFQMASQSLQTAVAEIALLLTDAVDSTAEGSTASEPL